MKRNRMFSRAMSLVLALCIAVQLVPISYESSAIAQASIVAGHIVDFVGSTVERYEDARMDVDGWELDAENSSQEVFEDAGATRIIASGAQVMFTAVGDKIAFKFNMPEGGKYSVSALIKNSWRNAKCNMYIDGALIGEVDFHKDTDWSESPKDIELENIGNKIIELTAGEHSLVFECAEFNVNHKRMLLQSISFAPKKGAKLDFVGSYVEFPKDATIEANGWECIAENSTPEVYGNASTKIYPQHGYMRVCGFKQVGDKISFKFEIPNDDVYDVSAITRKYNTYFGVDCDVFIDGENVGKVTSRSDVWIDNLETTDTVNTLKSVELSQGTHTLTLSCSKVGNSDGTASLYISCIEFAPKEDVIINFVGGTVEFPKDATIEADGWECVAENSTPEVMDNASTKIYPQYGYMRVCGFKQVGDKISFRFNVPRSGLYDVSALTKKHNTYFGVDCDVFIDGENIGEVIGRSDAWIDDLEATDTENNLKSVELSEGEHTLTLSCSELGNDSGTASLYISSVLFDLAYENPQLPNAEFKLCADKIFPIGVGEKGKVIVQGAVGNVIVDLCKAETMQITSQAEEIATATAFNQNGNLMVEVAGVAPGNTNIIVSAKINGMADTIEIPVTVAENAEINTPHIVKFGATVTKIEDLNIDTHGVEVNAEKTDEAIFGRGFNGVSESSMAAQLEVGEKIVFDFNVPESGNYSLDFTGGQLAWYGMTGEFFIDGEYVGEFCSNNPIDQDDHQSLVASAHFRDITLDKGVHELKVVRVDTESWRYGYFWWSELKMTPKVSPATFAGIKVESDKEKLLLGETSNVALSVYMSDGEKYFYSDSRAVHGAIKVREVSPEIADYTNGVVTAKKPGYGVFVIDATVAGDVMSAYWKIGVANGQMFDFKRSGTNAPGNTTLVKDTWQINTTGTNISQSGENYKLCPDGFIAEFDYGKTLALDVNIEKSGIYDIDLTGSQIANTGCLAGFWLDEVYLGSYDFSNEAYEDGMTSAEIEALATSKNVSEQFNTLKLSAGKHTLYIKRLNEQGGKIMRMDRMVLTRADEMPEVSAVSIQVPSMQVEKGHSMQSRIKVWMTNGREYRIGTKRDGSVDNENKLVFASTDNNVFTVSDSGVISGVEPGQAILNVDAYVHGEKYSTAQELETIRVLKISASDALYVYRTESMSTQLTAILDDAPYELINAEYITVTSADAQRVESEIVQENGKVYLKVTGLRVGNTNVYINAKADGVVASFVVPVSVLPPTETDERNFFLDFRSSTPTYPGDKPDMASLERHGWKVNYEQSDEYVYTNSTWGEGTDGIVTCIDGDQKLAIDFIVKRGGDFALEFFGTQNAQYGLQGDFYIDDIYIGYFDFSHPTETAWDSYVDLQTAFNSVSLSTGIHTLYCKARESWRGKEQMIRWGGVRFTGIDDGLSFAQTKLEVGKNELCVGESTDISFGAIMSDGSNRIMGKLLNGKDDPKNWIVTNVSDTNVIKIENGKLIGLKPGTATVTVTAMVDGIEKVAKETVTVDSGKLSSLEVSLDEQLYVGKIAELTISAKTENGKNINVENLAISAVSDAEEIAVVEGTTVKGVSVGSANIMVSATINGVTATYVLPVSVSEDGMVKVVVKAVPRMIRPNSEGTQIKVEGATFHGQKVDLNGAEIIYSNENDDVITVSESGWATPKALGSSIVTVTVKTPTFTGVGTVTIVVTNGKRGRSIYTDEKVEAARENIEKYSWAKVQKDSYVAAAEKYLNEEDFLWNSITTQELPRTLNVGYRYDPEVVYCRYCRADLSKHPVQDSYGVYGGGNSWLIDAFNAPWKIQCPACRRRFPSNDFAGFYESGIDENGNWSYELAKKNGSQYLTNQLYPEMGEGWGVDDGYGYKTGKTYSTAYGTVEEAHTYVAYYNYCVLNGALFKPALRDLAMAYLYTGEAKYGRVGAILLDRMADVYPDMYTAPYFPTFGNSDSTHPKGKIFGSIAECEFAPYLGRYYDALYPVFDDPYVVKYLNEKATKLDLDNDKSSPKLIRENIETNLLRETFKAAKEGNIYGNFGMHQYVVAVSAVALDTVGETDEMLEWIMTDDVNDWGDDYHSGGDVGEKLINYVDRDGGTQEGSVQYSSLWFKSLGAITELLAEYDGASSANIASFIKYQKMLESSGRLIVSRKAALAIGDSGSYAGDETCLSGVDQFVEAYRATGNVEMAQLAYFVNGNTVEGMRDGIFTRDPEQSRKKLIGDVIEKYGEYPFDDSVMMADYGVAILKDGSLYSEGSLSEYNNQRDFSLIFTRKGNHGHLSTLNLGIRAYGVDMAPEFGYPTAADAGDEYRYWGVGSVNHNLILVNDKMQNGIQNTPSPLHFDDVGRVKVMDVDAPEVYTETDVYRRTVVMVEVDDDVSYGVDFFRVKGGNEHLYSFHSQSNDISGYAGFKPVEYKGTYAGEDVTYRTTGVKNGYSYLTNIRKDKAPATGEISVDFKVTDYRNLVKDNADLHLRMTMLNDFELSEVTLAKGETPHISGNPGFQEFVLARRSGENLDSTFTTVFEPYKKDRYIKEMTKAEVSRADGQPINSNSDSVQAVKIELNNGRIDYIIYASNNKVEYIVDNKISFCGFVGVASYNNGEIIYSYLSDGVKLVDAGDDKGSIQMNENEYTASVVNFTRDLTFENEIVIRPYGEMDVENIKGRWMYIENDNISNGAYLIEDAKFYTQQDADWGKYPGAAAGDVVISLGDITLVRGADNIVGLAGDYKYNIAPRQYVSIPLSEYCDTTPVFEDVVEYNAIEGSKITVKVQATSPVDKEITYTAGEMPRGAYFDAETATISWTPDKAQIGEHHLSVIASDGAVETAQHLSIIVYKGSGGASGNAGAAGGGGSSTTPSTPTTPETPTTPDAPATGEGTGDAPETPAEKFVDLGNHTWAKDAIYSLVDKSVVNGTSANTYSPANNIKRADFAIMLVRAFGITEGEGENFADVDTNKYYAEELRLAKAAGIVNGVGNDKFNPEGEITRQDMILMLSRALDAMEVELSEANLSVLADFADAAEISDYAADAVSRAVKDGIIAGANGKINPLAKATRAEIAVMLSRVVES